MALLALATVAAAVGGAIAFFALLELGVTDPLLLGVLALGGMLAAFLLAILLFNAIVRRLNARHRARLESMSPRSRLRRVRGAGR